VTPNLDGFFNKKLNVFFLKTRWQFCITWLDGFGKIINAHVACSMNMKKSPQNDLMWPSNFEGDKLHLNLLRKNPNLRVAHLSSTQHIIAKLPTFKKIWHDRNGHETKGLRAIFSWPPYEDPTHMSSNLAYVIRLTSNFHRKNKRKSSAHPYGWISREKNYNLLHNRNFQHWCWRLSVEGLSNRRLPRDTFKDFVTS
jgi:hypothetical protein